MSEEKYFSLADKMQNILQQQLTLYQELLHLSEAQQQAIKEENLARIMEIIVEKQQYIQKINYCEQENVGYRKEWERIREQVDESIKESLNQTVTELRELISKLLTLEEENARRLQKQSKQVSQELENTQKSQQALHSYHNMNKEQQPRFFDKKSK